MRPCMVRWNRLTNKEWLRDTLSRVGYDCTARWYFNIMRSRKYPFFKSIISNWYSSIYSVGKLNDAWAFKLFQGTFIDICLWRQFPLRPTKSTLLSAQTLKWALPVAVNNVVVSTANVRTNEKEPNTSGLDPVIIEKLIDRTTLNVGRLIFKANSRFILTKHVIWSVTTTS